MTFLESIRERLWTALVTGPSLNVPLGQEEGLLDWTWLQAMGADPTSALQELLGEARCTQFRFQWREGEEGERQRRLCTRLYHLKNQAGPRLLRLGLPLVRLPAATSRLHPERRHGDLLAPLMFLPLDLRLELTREGGEIILESPDKSPAALSPNHSLLALAEEFTREETANLYTDDPPVSTPWQEVNSLARKLFEWFQHAPPPKFDAQTEIAACPRDLEPVEPVLLMSAVLGVVDEDCHSQFRDLNRLCAGAAHADLLQYYVRALEAGQVAPTPEIRTDWEKNFAKDHFVLPADPFQVRTLRRCLELPWSILDGAPGAGKAQALVNVISSWLSWGRRVLLVSPSVARLERVHQLLKQCGLDHLAAVVHDPHRDHHRLYQEIRDQLDQICWNKPVLDAAGEMDERSAQLEQVYDQIRTVRQALMHPVAEGGISIHDLIFSYLDCKVPEDVDPSLVRLQDITPAALSAARETFQEAYALGLESGFKDNPWRECVCDSPDHLDSLGPDRTMALMEEIADAAEKVDATLEETFLPYESGLPLEDQARARESLAADIERLGATARPDILERWNGEDPGRIVQIQRELLALEPLLELIHSHPLDHALHEVWRMPETHPPRLEEMIARLEEYERAQTRTLKFASFKKSAAAEELLAQFGLEATAGNAARVREHLTGLRARGILSTFYHHTLHADGRDGTVSDGELWDCLQGHIELLSFLESARGNPLLASQHDWIRISLFDPNVAPGYLGLLRSSARRARAIEWLSGRLGDSGLFDADWVARRQRELEEGGSFSRTVARLVASAHTLPALSRLQRLLAALPAPLAQAALSLLEAQVPADKAWELLSFAAARDTVQSFMEPIRALSGTQGSYVDDCIHAFLDIENRKRSLVAGSISQSWFARQHKRLKAPLGADPLTVLGTKLEQRLRIKQKMALVGDRVLKIRETVARGRKLGESDPLFDVRPVWMATPEVAAYLMPQTPIFDVLIVDDAHLLPLERGLSLLARAQHLVLAGDGRMADPASGTDSGASLLDSARAVGLEMLPLHVCHRKFTRSGATVEADAEGMIFVPPLPSESSHLRCMNVRGTPTGGTNPEEARMAAGMARSISLSGHRVGVVCLTPAQKLLVTSSLLHLPEEAQSGPLLPARVTVLTPEELHENFFDHIILSTVFVPSQGVPLAPAALRRLCLEIPRLPVRAARGIDIICSFEAGELESVPDAGQEPLGPALTALRRLVMEAVSPVVPPPRDVSPILADTAAAFEEATGWKCRTGWGSREFPVDLVIEKPGPQGDEYHAVVVDFHPVDDVPDPIGWDIFTHDALRRAGWKIHRILSHSLYPAPREKLLQTLRNLTLPPAPAEEG